MNACTKVCKHCVRATQPPRTAHSRVVKWPSCLWGYHTFVASGDIRIRNSTAGIFSTLTSSPLAVPPPAAEPGMKYSVTEYRNVRVRVEIAEMKVVGTTVR